MGVATGCRVNKESEVVGQVRKEISICSVFPLPGTIRLAVLVRFNQAQQCLQYDPKCFQQIVTKFKQIIVIFY